MARVSRYEDSRGAVLTAINDAHLRHGQPPSVRDLADTTDVAVATMHSYLTRLAEEGMIEWQRGRHRSLRCTPAGIHELSSLVVP